MKHHQHYKSDAVSTATPAQLVMMLYDRTLQGLARIKPALAPDGDRADLEEANRELNHCQRVLTELQLTLDRDKGGEIATNLDAIYSWCIEQLIDANIRKDPGPVEVVEKVVIDLRDAWAVAAAQASTPSS